MHHPMIGVEYIPQSIGTKESVLVLTRMSRGRRAHNASQSSGAKRSW